MIAGWAQLPSGLNFEGVGGVGVDGKDRVYVFDRDGQFLRSWCEGLFRRAHGVLIDGDENMSLTGDGDRTMRKCTTDGMVLFGIGIPDKLAP